MRIRNLTILVLASTACAVVACVFAGRELWGRSPAIPTEAPLLAPADRTNFLLLADPLLLDSDQVKTYDVLIENRTAEVVRFEPITCACSCSTSRREKDTLEPGEFTVVHLTVSVAGRSGKQQFRCQWVDESGRVWSAEVRVELIGFEQFEPSSITVGSVLPDSKIERSAKLVQTWRVGTVVPPAPALQLSDRNIEVELGESQLIKLGTSLIQRTTPVAITVHVQRHAGYDFSKVRTTTDSTLLQFSAQLSIDWNVKPQIVALPSRLVLRGGEAERVVRVESSDGQPIMVAAVRCDHPCIEVRKSPTESNAIVVLCKASVATPSPSIAEIVIYTGSDRNSRVTVAVAFANAKDVSK